MGISLARLDNRLLHGIVASQWTPRSENRKVVRGLTIDYQ